ncbi:MAG: hypothetical protein WA056_02320 [Gallionella sp.]
MERIKGIIFAGMLAFSVSAYAAEPETASTVASIPTDAEMQDNVYQYQLKQYNDNEVRRQKIMEKAGMVYKPLPPPVNPNQVVTGNPNGMTFHPSPDLHSRAGTATSGVTVHAPSKVKPTAPAIQAIDDVEEPAPVVKHRIIAGGTSTAEPPSFIDIGIKIGLLLIISLAFLKVFWMVGKWYGNTRFDEEHSEYAVVGAFSALFAVYALLLVFAVETPVWMVGLFSVPMIAMLVVLTLSIEHALMRQRKFDADVIVSRQMRERRERMYPKHEHEPRSEVEASYLFANAQTSTASHHISFSKH